MELLSVNIGTKQTQPKGDQWEITGIYKRPTREAVQISALGIREDIICDQKNHGGPDQAIYIYGQPDYGWWSAELGKRLEPGTFGENLTISGLQSADFHIGDRLQVGSVLLEITAPRIPCSTLARRMGDSRFVKQYRYAERPGLYCRVIREGVLQADEDVGVERYAGETLSILQMFRDYYDKHKTDAMLRRHLQAPIAIRAREEAERDLDKILASAA